MYYFFLGNTPDLSRHEIAALTKSKLVDLAPGIISCDDNFELDQITIKLGGTRKIATHNDTVTRVQLLDSLSRVVQSLPNKNVAITDYAGCRLDKSDLHALKSSIDRPIRLVSMDTNEHELVMLAHQHVAELNILPTDDPDQVTIALTTWIFDAEDWIKRDRLKPYRDIKRGMLPPKLARIMVNLATQGQDLSLYDPFCGTGTVLTEAALSGVKTLFGSDNSPEAVTGAEVNLDWVKSSYALPTINYQLLVADATHPPYDQVGCITTEPYMGPLLDERNPLPLDKLKDIAKGLDKLYRGAFKAWHSILPEGGRVVMTIPSFAVYGRVIPTISIDTITSLGYNYISSVAYGKPGAAVIRNITILEKI